MTIYSIQRDQRPNVCIVGIVTDSNIEDVVVDGWLLTQEASIEAVNNGPFEWKQNDLVLINFVQETTLISTGHAFFSLFGDFRSINPINPIYTNLNNVVAHAGGGQTDAWQLNLGINVIKVVTTAADSVKLPDDVLGQTCIVHNLGANSCNVFPFLGDFINSLAVNTAIALPAGSRALFIGTETLRWASWINP